MTVYLEEGIDKNTQKQIEEKLDQVNGAKIKEFISKEQAMVYLKDALGAQAGLLDGLEKNPLPSSYEILFSDVKEGRIYPEKIKENLEKIEGIAAVDAVAVKRVVAPLPYCRGIGYRYFLPRWNFEGVAGFRALELWTRARGVLDEYAKRWQEQFLVFNFHLYVELVSGEDGIGKGAGDF